MSTDLYLDHFNFSERPFTLLPDPDFIYWSKAHLRAFNVLEYGLATCAPLTVVTGDVGSGKTTLLRALLSKLDDDVTVGLVSNAQGGRGDLLRWVLNAFDFEDQPASDYVSMFQQFADFTISEYAAGRRVVLIIDEAQNLLPETLEELRLLTNINSNKDELLQIVLLGQPELRDIIALPELRQFAQRVSISYHLNPMDFEATCEYVRHRLRHVGGTGEEISRAAVCRVHSVSHGVPRLVNKICDIALVYAFSADAPAVDVDIIDELMDDGVILTGYSEPRLILTNPISNERKATE